MTSRHHVLLLAAALVVFFLQSFLSMRLLSPSSDEYLYLGAGNSYWKTGEIRISFEHPPLMKLLCSVPLLFMEVDDNFDDPFWTADPPVQWGYSHNFFWRNDVDTMLFWGRLPVILLSLLLGVFLWCWTRELFGPAAVAVAMFLYAFSPNLIAHSHFVTMDMGLSVFFLASVYFLWRYAKSDRWRDLVWCAVHAGLALGAKFSAIILYPVTGILLLVALRYRETRPDPSSPAFSARAGYLAKSLGLYLVISGLLVWVIYLCPRDPLFYWKGMLTVNTLHNPEAPMYLMGRFTLGKFPFYFFWAFLFKTPAVTLVLGLLALVFIRRFRTPSSLDEWFLAVPPLALFLFTVGLAKDLGYRYLLPVLPFLFIGVSRLTPLLFGTVRWRAIVAVMAAWYAFGTLWIYPHHIAYFNQVCGGPGNGHRLLDDSNIDWGQDLKLLKRYLDENNIGQIKLFDGWPGEPAYYGIDYEEVSNEEWLVRPTPGIYAMNIQVLIQGLYLADTYGAACNWLERYQPADKVGYSFWIYRFE